MQNRVLRFPEGPEHNRQNLSHTLAVGCVTRYAEMDVLPRKHATPGSTAMALRCRRGSQEAERHRVITTVLWGETIAVSVTRVMCHALPKHRDIWSLS